MSTTINKTKTPISKVKTEFFEIDLGHKTVSVRKWKAKDRKNFKKTIKETENIDKSIINSLVLNCLKDKSVALTNSEIQYLLIELRKISISNKLVFNYKCDKCDKDNSKDLTIDYVNNFNYKPWKPFKEVEFGNIKNVNFFNENKEDDDDINEIAFHTMSINGDISKTFNEVIEFYEEMDVQKFDEIYEHFLNYTFTLNNEAIITCNFCKNKQTFEFDEIPNFFPNSWLK